MLVKGFGEFDKDKLLDLNICKAETLINRFFVFIVSKEARNNILDMLAHICSSLQQGHHVHVLVSLLIQESIQEVLVYFVAVLTPDGCLEQFIQIHSIEEFFQLSIENLHLMLEVPGQ